MLEDIKSHFEHLVDCLTKCDRRLEIDVLPSSFPLAAPLLFSESDAALAVSKSLLAKCFLIARLSIFDSATAASAALAPAEKQSNGTREEAFSLDDRGFAAAKIILLWEPNHVSVINRCRQYLCDVTSDHALRGPAETASGEIETRLKNDQDRKLVLQELNFLTSLLTSPLPKHNKSSSLWSYRLWIIKVFILPSVTNGSWRSDSGLESLSLNDWLYHTSDLPLLPDRLLDKELQVVFAAGSRHPRNYYAWNYARQLLSFFHPISSRTQPCHNSQGKSPNTSLVPTNAFLDEKVLDVSQWSFAHPRDISGWTFLVWILERRLRTGRDGPFCDDEGPTVLVQDTYNRVLQYKKDLKWSGASLDWTVAALGRLLQQPKK